MSTIARNTIRYGLRGDLNLALSFAQLFNRVASCLNQAGDQVERVPVTPLRL